MGSEKKSKPKSDKAKQREELNKQRRERYKNDPAYREEVNAQNRRNYRTRIGLDVTHAAVKTKKLLAKYGKRRKLVDGARVLTFTVKESAQVLGSYNEQSIYRWIRDGRLPPMMYTAYEETQGKSGTYDAEIAVYIEGEMYEMARILNEHQQEYSYYRACHTDTVDKLYDAVEAYRK